MTYLFVTVAIPGHTCHLSSIILGILMYLCGCQCVLCISKLGTTALCAVPILTSEYVAITVSLENSSGRACYHWKLFEWTKCEAYGGPISARIGLGYNWCPAVSEVHRLFLSIHGHPIRPSEGSALSRPVPTGGPRV